MRINNNITALNTHRQYGINNASIAKSVEKLSSGYRINRAGDDAAGLAISEKMRAQIRGLTMASKNSQDAISLVQTAEGALQESHNILQRMRELAVQSASDTNETVIDRGALQQEFDQLIKELNDTASKTKFNDQGLIDGTFSKNTTSAVSDKAAHGLAWANERVAAGTYTITVDDVLDKPAITDEKGSSVETSSGMVATSKDGNVTVTFTGATDAVTADERLNGVWNLSIDNGKVVATNLRNGQSISRELSGISANGTVDIELGTLGKLTLTATSAINASSFISLSGQFKVTGCVDKQDATYTKIAKMGDDEVVLQTGQTMLNFVNSGISVQLKDALAVNTKTGTTDVDVAAGTITVSKGEGKDLVIQTGANEGDNLGINISKMDAYSLGVAASSIGNRLDASVAITQVNSAINIVSTQRAALGALQNRLDHKIANLDTSAENLTAAESRIRDVDMAKEMTTFMKNSILSQASTAMLAQANSLPQGVLQLLG